MGPWLLRWLESPERSKIDLELDRMRRYLTHWGNPHQGIPAVLVGGTNGKGSCAAMLSAVLTAMGLRTGLFTSPHLKSYAERFRSNDREATDTELQSILTDIRVVCDRQESGWGRLTTFEILTLAAFILFREAKVDLLILEVGLGGRLDATNVVDPVFAIITNIDLDHEEYLGSTREAIAYEKAGILRPGITLVTGVKDQKLIQIFQKSASHHLKVVQPETDFDVTRLGGEGWAGQWLLLQGRTPLSEPFFIPLLGQFQARNSALAAQAIFELIGKGFVQWSAPKFIEGMRRTFWPGRFQVLQKNGRLWILDGAHNPAGMDELRRELSELSFPRPLFGLIGIGSQKNAEKMMQEILPVFDGVILTRSKHSAAREPKELRNYIENSIPVHEEPSVERALHYVGEHPEIQSICATGSLYLIGELL